MSDYETRMADEEELQLRNQRFMAALRYATIPCKERAGARMDYPTFNEAVELADGLIAELAAPTVDPDTVIPYG